MYDVYSVILLVSFWFSYTAPSGMHRVYAPILAAIFFEVFGRNTRVLLELGAGLILFLATPTPLRALSV